jgi:glucose-6-phosphate 1-dehydrogenase
MDTARGNQTLFMRGDKVMAFWSLIDSILAMSANITPTAYVTGSMGLDDTLLEMNGRQWIDPDQDWR